MIKLGTSVYSDQVADVCSNLKTITSWPQGSLRCLWMGGQWTWTSMTPSPCWISWTRRPSWWRVCTLWDSKWGVFGCSLVGLQTVTSLPTLQSYAVIITCSCHLVKQTSKNDYAVTLSLNPRGAKEILYYAVLLYHVIPMFTSPQLCLPLHVLFVIWHDYIHSLY